MHRLADKRTQWPILFRKCFVTVRPIAIKFVQDLNNMLRLKFKEFHLNLSNFTPLNKRWCSVHNGLMSKINIFFLGNDNQHTFHKSTKNCDEIGWRHHVVFCVSKNRSLLLVKDVLSYISSKVDFSEVWEAISALFSRMSVKLIHVS